MSPFVVLAESVSSNFDVASSISMVKDVFVSLMDIIKSEPILASAFVASVLIPVAAGIIYKVKHA